LEVLGLLRLGLTNEEIAGRLGISLDGAKWHVSEIISRLGVASRYEAVALAYEAPGRSRWAPLLAPLSLVKSVKIGIFGYIASTAVIAVAIVGVSLLVWGVIQTDGDDENPLTESALTRTGVVELDHVIDLLVRQDVEGLIGIVRFEPIGCSLQQTVGSPPRCAAGEPEGTPVDAFPISSCEGYYATTVEEVRQAFGLALLRQPGVAVYAVMRDNSVDRQVDSFYIATTENRPGQATSDVAFWHVFADGQLAGLISGCGPIGAAQQVEYRFPNPAFVLGPYNQCAPPPGETANFMVSVESLSPGSVKPQFWGPAKLTIGASTGERAIINVTSDTEWIGDIDRLQDVRAGMELQAVGIRQDDCTIDAQTILTPGPITFRSDALGIAFGYPYNWEEGAAPMPYASCAGCVTLGPESVQYPYGVSLFTQPPSPGCTVSCHCSVRCIAAAGAPELSVMIGGSAATQLEFRRQPPLDGSGETAIYAEIWTAIPRATDTLVVVAFFREDDPVGERYVRREYEELLDSLTLLAP
jgi:hypothetical protein